MSSRCRNSACALLLVALALGGCERERREVAGGPVDADRAAVGAHYENNAYHITQGGRLFKWFNCTGCHASGGGGMGPNLMDSPWRYGGTIDAIHATILDGRPRGMPAFKDKLTDAQAWQLAAYVRALAGNVRKDAAPSRSEGVSGIPPPTRLPEQPPTVETVVQ